MHVNPSLQIMNFVSNIKSVTYSIPQIADSRHSSMMNLTEAESEMRDQDAAQKA